MRRLVLILLAGVVVAEDGLAGWLRYAPLPDGLVSHYGKPSSIVGLNSSTSSPVYTAAHEVKDGFQDIFGQEVALNPSSGNDPSNAVIIGTVDQYTKEYGQNTLVPQLEEDGFWLSIRGQCVQILGQNERGALYGAFEYLSMLAQGNFSDTEYATNPNAPIRWTNEWDNLDGSIERGYGGPSIFFSNGTVVQDLTRAAQYARLLASIRVNAVVVDNVNANATLLTPSNIQGEPIPNINAIAGKHTLKTTKVLPKSSTLE